MSQGGPQQALTSFLQRGVPDETVRRANRRRGCLAAILSGTTLAGCFFCLIAILMGVPQSFLGQWWMKPPRYPEAILADRREGEVCQMPAPGVYCYEWFYRTPDAVEDVVRYYQQLEWPLHAPITFEWRRGRRFTQAWVAESCIHVVSNVSCYQIIVHPVEDGNTEIYILERGAMGHIRPGDR